MTDQPLDLRSYTFLGTTQSLCPECRRVVPAKIVSRDGRVYFQKRCPEHGDREDFVCSDVTRYDQMEFAVPAKVPREFGVEPDRGCPLDCGLCTDHEQHTCIGLVELTSSCNLSCPMCYAESGAHGHHLTLEQCKAAIDRLVEVEGRPEVLQLSGGEPTIHPQFREVLAYALEQPIDYVMINTNGVRFAHDPELVQFVADRRDRVEIYFQFDGLNDGVYEALRGEPLLKIKRKALAALEAADLNVMLVATLQPGVNDDQLGPLVEFALKQNCVTGLGLQPATYSGRHVLPAELEARMTYPDVIDRICEQTDGLFAANDFLPLPCAHPNCHSVAYAYRTAEAVVPLTRFIDAKSNLGLLANGIAFRRTAARDLIQRYLGDQGCCAGGSCDGAESTVPVVPLEASGVSNASVDTVVSRPAGIESHATSTHLANEFFERALGQDLGARDVFRITITSFLDAYNFDVRRVMKCCTHHILPSGHVIPFCAYNTLYRDGHVPLPPLRPKG